MTQITGNFSFCSRTSVIRGTIAENGLSTEKLLNAAADVKGMLQAVMGRADSNVELVKGNIGDLGSIARCGMSTLKLISIDVDNVFVLYEFCGEASDVRFYANSFVMNFTPESYLVSITSILSVLSALVGLIFLIASFVTLPNNELIGMALIVAIILIFSSVGGPIWVSIKANNQAIRAAHGVSEYLNKLGEANLPGSILNPAFRDEQNEV